MSVGIIVPLPAYTLNPAFIASKAEALGFESLWYHEHPILPVDSASPFPATGGEIPFCCAFLLFYEMRWSCVVNL